MISYTVVNILDMKDAVGEDALQEILSDFSCSKNMEIQNFVRNSALDFAKRKVAITYLVIDNVGNIAAIFALAHKVVEIKNQALSSSGRKKLMRFSKLDTGSNTYTVSAFLIAQFGKSDTLVAENDLTGNRLMDYVFEVLTRVQHEIGGGLIFLECEEKPELLSFYQNEENRFKPFGERYSELDHVKYIQLLRLF